MLTAPKTRLSVVGRAECLNVTGQPGQLSKPVSLSDVCVKQSLILSLFIRTTLQAFY